MLHAGICVHKAEPMVEMLRNTVGVKEVSHLDMPEAGQRITYVWVGDEGSLLELLEPLGEVEGTVSTFLKKNGEGLHHIAFSVEDVNETAADFEAQGCRIIGKGKGVAYVHPKSAFGVLYELFDGNYKN